MSNKTQIPVYRAEKVGSDGYATGFLMNENTILDYSKYHIDNKNNEISSFTIDPSTLAIHFPDMIDSEGAKIFASLSEDGKGGDRFDAEPAPEEESCMATIIFKNGYRTLYEEWDSTLPLPRLETRELKDIKVTGVDNGNL